MDLIKFYEAVDLHPDIEGKGIDRENKTVYVFHKMSGLTTSLPVDSIRIADWKDIEEVLTCKREPVVLMHMTRVIGYYSRIDNWNPSKIGELADRHKGDYSLPEVKK